jgi:hypothetical protein
MEFGEDDTGFVGLPCYAQDALKEQHTDVEYLSYIVTVKDQ